MLPDLPPTADTRDALHAYCQVLGGVRRQLTEPHPRWWHSSLEVHPGGFSTGAIEAAGLDGDLELRLDVESLEVRVLLDGGEVSGRSLATDGPTPARLGAAWIAELARLGAHGLEPDTRWSEERSTIEAGDAARWHAGFLAVGEYFSRFRQELSGERGPVQLWPHHFDLSFEWFGRDLAASQNGGDASAAQIGFGFSAGDPGLPAPYFYANPWPFDPRLAETELPEAAVWHTGGWNGSLLPYESVRETPDGLTRYLEVIYRLASPGLD